jgi:hypothetical protein
MQHGKISINFDEQTKSRAFTYMDSSGKEYPVSLDTVSGSSFSVGGIGSRSGETYSTEAKGLHCCGARGFGLGEGDECPACESGNRAFNILKDITFLLEGAKD